MVGRGFGKEAMTWVAASWSMKILQPNVSFRNSEISGMTEVLPALGPPVSNNLKIEGWGSVGVIGLTVIEGGLGMSGN